ncbi:hypothetical protein SAMN05421856_10573 [Chryseobacterium taichungense]|uniref:Uncharacterized protein n=1 Tax=Chryseobacterium taichungense TaxID=295069 RepID=A0A1H8A2A5_9FLAO|nr:hypothetical protein [Chryseobacterium taichungense]SEM65052.1 hypothetical protein SAMN05421856_10573 [Chryseobacterium taichungense]
MKNNKISLETHFWSGQEVENPFEFIEVFFEYGNLDYYKETLNQFLFHTEQQKLYEKGYPGQIFILYTAFRSFLKACFKLRSKSEKWKVRKALEKRSILEQASLTSEEYQNPFVVFQNAFIDTAFEEYEFFLCEITHLSLSPFGEEFDYDLITPFIHLTKMLDAAQIIRERGIKKIKDKKSISRDIKPS